MNDKRQPNDDESHPAAQDGTQKHGPELEATHTGAGENYKPGMDNGPTTPVHLMSPEELRQFVQENSQKALARHLKTLTKEQIGDCCIKHPGFALLFCINFISMDQLKYCIEKDPRTASVYASELTLTEKQIYESGRLHPGTTLAGFEPEKFQTVLLAICIRKEPGPALKQSLDSDAFLTLNDEQFEYCCIKAPAKALKFVAYKMHDALFKECARLEPWEAYKNAPDRLSVEELLRYACDHGYVIRNLLAANPSNPIVMKLAPYLGLLDEDTAKVVARAIAADL